MRVTNIFSGRPQPWDRNPIGIMRFFEAAAVGPHALVARDTYTIPTGRKCFVSWMALNLRRATAAGTPGEYEVRVQLQRADASQQFRLKLKEINNIANTYFRRELGGQSVLLAGDVISVLDADLSTGGTIDMDEEVQGIEFDG